MYYTLRVDGFRFEQDVGRKIVRKMVHVGRVVIGGRVEIGANCTVDRAAFEVIRGII